MKLDTSFYVFFIFIIVLMILATYVKALIYKSVGVPIYRYSTFNLVN
jgi:hypothetical protein